MRIAFGTAVRTRDGATLGEVDGLVVAGDNGRLRQVLVGRGLFGHQERLVEVSALEAGDGEGLRIDMDRAGAEALPLYVREETVDPARTPDDPLIMPATGVGGPVMVEDVSSGRDYLDGGSLIMSAPIDPPVVEVRSNLLDTEVLVDNGADVIAADGDKLGDLHGVEIDGDATITGLTVRSGFVFHEEHDLPGSAVRTFGRRQIHLSAGREAARRTAG